MLPLFVRAEVALEEVDSTSDEARRRVEAGGVALPMLVVARRQIRGRGQGANAWWSDAGSLTFTLAVDPAALGLRPAHEPRLALAVAVAIVDALATAGAGVAGLGVRWPNDLEAGGRKLGGILPERVDAPEGPRLLIGVGLNLTTDLASAPAEVRRMATSLEIELGPGRGEAAGVPTPRRLLEACVGQIGSTITALAADDPGLAARWEALDLLRGRPVRVDQAGAIVEGTGAGIDPEGALRVWTGEGIRVVRGGRVLRDL